MSHQIRNVKAALGEYISQPEWKWTHYITQTFDDSKCRPYSEICEHSWRYFLNRLGGPAKMLYGWVFAERGSNGRLHWHAICHLERNKRGEPTDIQLWRQMYEKYGRNVTLTYKPGIPVSQEADAIFVGMKIARLQNYLTKYVAKDASGGDAWWDFGGFIDGSEADASQLCRAIGVPTAAI